MKKQEDITRYIYIKDFNMIDRKLLNKQFIKVDEDLLKCVSYEAQKKLLINYYTSMNFTRDFLIGRKLQLVRLLKFGFEFQFLESARMFVSFSIGVITKILFDVEWWIPCIVSIFLLFMFIQLSKKVYFPINDEECKIYEIRNFEIKLISRVLDLEKEKVSLTELNVKT